MTRIKTAISRFLNISRYSEYSNIIIPALLSVILFTIAIFGLMLPYFENDIISERKESVKNLAYVVYTYMDHYNAQVKEGKLSLKQAQDEVVESVKYIRYGPELKDYFWIHDGKSKLLMHPYRPDLYVPDLIDSSQAIDTDISNESIEMVENNGEGYIEYVFDRYDDPLNLALKVTFVKGFEPWGWIIGTGMYVDDVKAKIADVKRKMTYAFLSILLLILLLQFKLISQNLKSNRKRSSAEQRLRKSESRFKELAELLPQMVFELDIDGNIIYANRYAFEFTGYTSKEVSEGFNIASLFSEEEFSRVRNNMKKLIAGEDTEDSEYKLIRKSGEQADIHIYSNVILHDDKPIGYRGIIIDITDFKKLQEQGQRAQRLEVAGRIAGQVAHDFNNLLAPLMAYPDLIKNTLSEDHPSIQYINKIEVAAAYIAEINQQLLTLSRRGHYNQIPMDINKVVKQVINQLQPIPSYASLDIDLVEYPMTVKGGAAQVNRILLNLISNSIEALEGDGIISIKTENYYQDKPAGNYYKIPQGEYIKITISDTGHGISPETLPKIFDPFFTTKLSDKRKGSGLGLTVVHSIMEDHNGFIDYASDLGVGTTFYLYFPITREKLRSSNDDRIIGGDESILVVDDDELQREVTTKLLENLGYVAEAVDCGEKAINLLRKKTFDLIVLDMIMPGHINGSETYQKAIAINPDQKAIIVSGYAENEHVQQALDLGAGAFIKKPLTLKSLSLAVRSELDSKEDNEISSAKIF